METIARRDMLEVLGRGLGGGLALAAAPLFASCRSGAAPASPAAGPSGVGVGGVAGSAGAPEPVFGPEAYGGFRMGIQSYTFIKFDFEGVLARMKQLGIAYGEFFRVHLPVTEHAPTIEWSKRKLAAAGVTPWALWVKALSTNHAENKAAFEFAKALGVRVITGQPGPETFESLSVLAREYGIKIGIHNHGPGANYDKVADVANAIEKWPVEIGACVDTGHFIRSGEDPVAALRTLGPRVHEVHLKDATSVDVFNILGQGRLDVVGTLRALKDIRFDGCLALEYELNKNDPMADVRACLAFARDAVKRL